VVPTLGNDHQFDFDYTVDHLAALVDATAADAVVLADFTDWLRAGCIYQAGTPEHHVALEYSQRTGAAIWGTRSRPAPGGYDRAVQAAGQLNERYPSLDAVEHDYRPALEQTTARIAKEFSFTMEPQTLRVLLKSGFAARAGHWTPPQRDGITSFARQFTDSLSAIISANPKHRRWVVLLWWGHALHVTEFLRTQLGVRVRPVETFLSAADATLPKHMDARHIAWILSGALDEWYGMWAPQVLPTERLARLLQTLRALAPRDQTTRFLEARWLMQNRDYAAAESILVQLAADTSDARFPFPLNGKWARPPWSSVRNKAKLNLAFLFDLRSARDSALQLYGELLATGDALDVEARAAGYIYDDLRWVVESYKQRPYPASPRRPSATLD